MGATTTTIHTSPTHDVQEALAVLSRYRQRNSWKAWQAIALNYSVITSCILFSTFAYRSPHVHTSIAVLGHVCSAFLISSRLRGFENLIHEASHGNLFSNVRDHERFQCLYAFPVLRILEDYRSSHMRHHRFLGDAARDPDILRIHYLGLQNIAQNPIWYIIGLPCTGFLTVEYMRTVVWEFVSSPSQRISKSFYCLVIGTMIYQSNAFWLFAAYYLFPLLIILPTTRYWAEAAEHVGTDMTATFGSSRNNIGFWHQWYLHPHNDGYHALHHLHSQIPFYLLPMAHQVLRRSAEGYAKKTVISRGVWETFKQMVDWPTVVRVGLSSGDFAARG